MLEINNLEVKYKNVILGIRDISLDVPEKSIIAFLGANGAGKTTTIRAITGLLKFHDGQITNGEIKFKGESIGKRSARAIGSSGIMQVPEGRRVFSQLTVEENLFVGCSTTSLSGRERKKMVDKIYGYFPILGERKNQHAGFLSGGEQQMLAIGRGLIAQPKLLIIDELSLGLAPLITWDLAKKLVEIRETENNAVLLVEQNALLALAISDYGYIVENGKIVLEGRRDSLMNDNLFKAYLGEDNE